MVLIIIGSIIFTLCLVLYYLSETIRIKKGLTKLSKYDSFVLVRNSTFTNQGRLCDYQVMSSFRPYCNIRQRYDYVSIELLMAQMRLGCRFLWLDIFCEDMSAEPEPCLYNGIEKGNYNTNLNKIYFEECITQIGQAAFTSGKVNNYYDPLILGLNLKVRKNIYCLGRIKDILIKHLGSRLLDIEHSILNTNKDIAEIVLKDISGENARIIILASSGSEDSSLQEIINGQWDSSIGNDTTIQALSYKSIDDEERSDVVKQNVDILSNYNKTHLTIIHPETDLIFTEQFDPQFGFDYGCQFICMNWLKLDDYIRKYLDKFKSNAFIIKDNVTYNKPQLPTQRSVPTIEPSQTTTPLFKCPEQPNESYSDTESAWDSAEI